MPVATIVLLALAAFGAGTVDAIAGGGGLITVPALLAAGLPPHVALGTNKGQSTWGSFAALVTYWRAGHVDRVQAQFAFPLGLVGSYVGARLVLGLSQAMLRPIIIVLLICAATLLVVKKPARVDDAGRARWAIAAALALVIGAYDGFFGPGTGTFLIVGFVMLCGRSPVAASADAKVVNFAANLAALVTFAREGVVVWEIAVPMACGQLCGGMLGARLAMRGGARAVRVMVLVVAGALIAKLAWDLAGA